jgi:hypothetical protein
VEPDIVFSSAGSSEISEDLVFVACVDVGKVVA